MNEGVTFQADTRASAKALQLESGEFEFVEKQGGQCEQMLCNEPEEQLQMG